MATANVVVLESVDEFDDSAGLESVSESTEPSEFGLVGEEDDHGRTSNGRLTSNHSAVRRGSEDSEYGLLNVDSMVQSRIVKIYQRLEVTDTNLRRIEDLLKQQQQVAQPPQATSRCNRGRSRSSERRPSISSQSSIDVFQHRRERIAVREAGVKSAESHQRSDDQKSPTLEQLQRLTQSMQDLHNYQQRFQDDLRTEVLNRSSNASSDIIRELSNWLRQNVEDSFRPKEILDKLTTLQFDMKSTEQKKHTEDAHNLLALETLRHEMEDLRRNMASLSNSSNKSEHFQKLSQLESQQLRVEANLEVLTKHFDVWSHHSMGITRCSRCDGHQQSLQHQLVEAVRISLEASRKVNQAAEELRRIDSSSDGLANETDNVKDKAKKIIKKLKLKCEDSSKDKERYRRRCQLTEEKCDILLSEKENICAQLEDLQVKLNNAQKEQQDIKTSFFEEQKQGSLKEITIQRLKFVYEESERQAHQSHQELQKSKSDNDKLIIENKSLCLQNESLKRELADCKIALTTTNIALDTMKQTGNNVEHLKEKLDISENHRKDVVLQLSKQLENERENRVKLEKEIFELKASSVHELSDAIARKEREHKPIIEMLKKQISDFQNQINDLYQENKNLSNERAQLNGELLRLQTENQQTTRKYEKLLKNFYSKNEELHNKVHRIDELDGNFTDFRKITHKMETEYKTMLCNINLDVDRTMQLWNMSLDDSVQAPASVSGIQCHPKVVLVDIQSKLKWLQDDICLTSRGKFAREKATNDLGSSPTNVPSDVAHNVDPFSVRSSSPKAPVSDRGANRMNIQTASNTDVKEPASWDISAIAKDTNLVGEASLFTEFGSRYQVNNKQLNSTETTRNLPQNRITQRLKEARGTHLSSLSDESTDHSFDS